VTVSENGQMLERFAATAANLENTYVIDARGRQNELVIETDDAVNPARSGIGADARDLGLQLRGMSWRPAR
jgi:hypothetical protein